MFPRVPPDKNPPRGENQRFDIISSWDVFSFFVNPQSIKGFRDGQPPELTWPNSSFPFMTTLASPIVDSQVMVTFPLGRKTPASVDFPCLEEGA